MTTMMMQQQRQQQKQQRQGQKRFTMLFGWIILPIYITNGFVLHQQPLVPFHHHYHPSSFSSSGTTSPNHFFHVQSDLKISTTTRATTSTTSTTTSTLLGASTSSAAALNFFRSRDPNGERGANINKKKSKTPDIFEVESHADWMEVLYGDVDDTPKLTVVTFTAGWCKFCQKFNLKWKRKLVPQYYQQQQQNDANTDNSSIDHAATTSNGNNAVGIRFASVEFGANKKLCQSLQIRALPTIQFYFDGELLNSFPCGPKGFPIAKETLQKYAAMTSKELQHAAAMWEIEMAKKEQQQQMNDNIHNDKNHNDGLPIIMLEEDNNGQDSASSSSSSDFSNTSEPNQQGEDVYEPSLYLRKRDRLKQKIRRRLQRSQS